MEEVKLKWTRRCDNVVDVAAVKSETLMFARIIIDHELLSARVQHYLQHVWRYRTHGTDCSCTRRVVLEMQCARASVPQCNSCNPSGLDRSRDKQSRARIQERRFNDISVQRLLYSLGGATVRRCSVLVVME